MDAQNNNTAGATAPADLTSQELVVDDTPRAIAPDEASAPAAPIEETVPPQPTPPSRAAAANVQQDAEVFTPLEQWNPAEVSVALPSDSFDRVNEAIQSLPNVDITSDAEGREWADILERSQYAMQFKGVFNRTVEREDSAFRQAVPSEKGFLSAAAPSFRDAQGTKLTGERAVLRVRALMGMGSIVQIPLWHSGFWLTLKAPSEGELLELHRRLAEEKIELGRRTWGLAFANNSVFFAGTIMDFALTGCYYDCTLKDNRMENVRAKISCLDIPLIAWGLACAIWPRGFQYARAILDGDQNKTIKEKLNLGKILWTDTTALTDWQIAHMAQRSGNTMTNEMVERYRQEFTRGQGRTIKLNDTMQMTLRVPGLDTYLTSGMRWVNNIVAMVDRSFALPMEGEARDKYILDHGRATNMRQYAHWVESIQVGTPEQIEQGTGNSIDDEETVDSTLDVLSADDTIRERYFAGVREYMEDATMAIIAVPAATEKEESGLPRFPHLLPLDALSTFFTLLVQKIAQIEIRE